MAALRVWICVVVLARVTIDVSSKTCEYRDRCSCVFDDGSGMIDLWTLGYQDGNAQFQDYTAAVDTYMYSYNPCYPFSEGTCTNVAVCQYDYLNTLGYVETGDPEKVTYAMDGENLIVQYTSSDGSRTTHATYYCDPSLEAFPFSEVIGESSPLNYYLNVRSIAACTVPAPADWGQSSGLSGGSILLIIFFVVIVVYLIAGVAFNKVKLQAQGKDVVPNLGFWSALPGLVKDGCKFAIGLVCRKRSVQYDAT